MPTENIIKVELESRAYPIVVSEEDQKAWATPLKDLVAKKRVAVVTDETVAHLYRQDFSNALTTVGVGSTSWHVVPPGEESKCSEILWQLYDDLLEQRLGRDGIICALGGGVVGDLAGFVAATIYRGITYIQVPTTLLAMVDSSIGGKTGINHRTGKNLIGAFHQPAAVLMNLKVLSTLGVTELRSGFAEIIKCAVVLDEDLFELLEGSANELLLLKTSQLLDIVLKSAKIKTNVVCSDEREAGIRMLLNFGHTIGHAIEQATGFGEWSHGDAIAVGMIMSAEFGVALGVTAPHIAPRIAALCGAVGLPIAIDGEHRRTLSGAIAQDKKVRGENIQFVVPQDMGRGQIIPIPLARLSSWLSEITEPFSGD